MMICKYCGAELEDESSVCPQCGKPTGEPDAGQETSETAPPAIEDILSEASGWQTEPTEEPSAESTEPAEPAEAKPAVKRKEPVWLFLILGLVAVAAVAVLIFFLVRGGKEKAPEQPASSPDASDTAVQPETGEQPAPDNPSEDSDGGEAADTYTVPNEQITAEMASAVAASCDGQELSNTELSYYYWNQFYSWANAYGDYLSYFLDVNTPLSEQSYPDDPERSWESFLLDAALDTYHQTTVIVEAAEEAGFAIDGENTEYLELLPDTLANNAERMDMDSADEFLQNLYGPYADVESYTKFVRDSLISYGYLNELFAGIEYEPDEVEAWFDGNQADYEAMGLTREEPNMVNVRHILIKPVASADAEGENEEAELTDQDWVTAKQRAETLLSEWQSGEATEDAFALLASENSDDPGSQGTGGLYEGVYPGEMVAAFNDWCFDESRQPGDTGIVETEYGYHIMYFSGTQDHAHWYEVAEQDYLASRQQEILDGLTAKAPLQINYDKIVLMESRALQ